LTVIGDVLAREARRVPQREAVVFKGVRLTYAELDAAVDRWAAALQRHGVRHGDRLALLAPNSDGFLLCFFAGLRLGAILVPVNTRLAAPEVAHILSDAGAAVLVVDAELAPLTERALPLVDGPAPAVVALDALAAARPIPGWTAPAVSEDDDALIIYTSGRRPGRAIRLGRAGSRAPRRHRPPGDGVLRAPGRRRGRPGRGPGRDR
jgi:fatty-acyl-CoA synthase